MKISTSYDNPPIPDRRFDWSATDDDTYDGAEDSTNRHQVGRGATEAEAVEDLIQRLLDDCPAEVARRVRHFDEAIAALQGLVARDRTPDRFASAEMLAARAALAKVEGEE